MPHAVLLYAAAIVHSVVATDGDCMDNVSVSLLQMDVHVSSHSDVNKIGTRSQSMSYLVGSSLAEGRKHEGTHRGAAAFAHGVSYTLVQGLPNSRSLAYTLPMVAQVLVGSKGLQASCLMHMVTKLL